MSCDRKIGPFDCCSVVEGDCLELMKRLPDGCVDAVITDPPYGIGANLMTLGKGKKEFDRGGEWDAGRIDVGPLLAIGKYHAIWGGNYYSDFLEPTNRWLVWHKLNDDRSFSECELAWTNFSAQVRHLSHHWGGEEKQHPTQKPLAVMEWVVSQLPADADTILDPFLGSGTTAVAAKKLGRHFLGFEISPEYCQIARDRIARVEAQPNLFEPQPEQLTL